MYGLRTGMSSLMRCPFLKNGQNVKKNVLLFRQPKCGSVADMSSQSIINFDSLDGQQIVVTHIETPEKFFSRLMTDENNFNGMGELIWQRVCSPFTEEVDFKNLRQGMHLLSFSTIHQIWCRCRVEEVPNANPRDSKGIRQKPSVKVRLIDFGSLEVVSYDNLRTTTAEIIEYNYGQSFCFECRLFRIRPYESEEWSSYANYLFEKQAKDKAVTLRLDEYRDGVVVCDLAIHWQNESQSCKSLADFLVHTRVASYRMGHDFYHRNIPVAGDEGQLPKDEDFEYDSDEDLNRIDFENEDKLYYI